METIEFKRAFFATFGQGIESFADGAQPSDAADFVDEAFSWPNAISGLGGAFKTEALEQTPETIDAMFAGDVDDLIGRGMHPMDAFAIVNGVKTFYSTYCTIVQRAARREDGSDLVKQAAEPGTPIK